MILNWLFDYDWSYYDILLFAWQNGIGPRGRKRRSINDQLLSEILKLKTNDTPLIKLTDSVVVLCSTVRSIILWRPNNDSKPLPYNGTPMVIRINSYTVLVFSLNKGVHINWKLCNLIPPYHYSNILHNLAI